jgi:hypothetical protein
MSRSHQVKLVFVDDVSVFVPAEGAAELRAYAVYVGVLTVAAMISLICKE